MTLHPAPATAILSDVRVEAASVVEKARRVLAAGPPLCLAALFGSIARGEGRPDSDVDIAIVPVDPELTLADEMDLQFALEQAIGRTVDLVRLDHGSTLLRFRVARDGVPILARSPVDWTRFQARAAAQWCDEGPALEHAAERFRRRLAEEAR